MAARRKEQIPELVRLRVLVAFNGLRVGDAGLTELDARVQGWVNAGLAEIEGYQVVSFDGEDPTGPGEPESDPEGGEPDGR